MLVLPHAPNCRCFWQQRPAMVSFSVYYALNRLLHDQTPEKSLALMASLWGSSPSGTTPARSFCSEDPPATHSFTKLWPARSSPLLPITPSRTAWRWSPSIAFAICLCSPGTNFWVWFQSATSSTPLSPSRRRPSATWAPTYRAGKIRWSHRISSWRGNWGRRLELPARWCRPFRAINSFRASNFSRETPCQEGTWLVSSCRTSAFRVPKRPCGKHLQRCGNATEAPHFRRRLRLRKRQRVVA